MRSVLLLLPALLFAPRAADACSLPQGGYVAAPTGATEIPMNGAVFVMAEAFAPSDQDPVVLDGSGERLPLRASYGTASSRDRLFVFSLPEDHDAYVFDSAPVTVYRSDEPDITSPDAPSADVIFSEGDYDEEDSCGSSGDAVTLMIDPPSDAVAYVVYRDEVAITGRFVGERLTYDSPGPGEHCYDVTALDAAGLESARGSLGCWSFDEGCRCVSGAASGGALGALLLPWLLLLRRRQSIPS